MNHGRISQFFLSKFHLTRFPNFQCSANLSSQEQECRTHNITWWHTQAKIMNHTQAKILNHGRIRQFFLSKFHLTRFPNFQCSANLSSQEQECRTHNITWWHTQSKMICSLLWFLFHSKLVGRGGGGHPSPLHPFILQTCVYTVQAIHNITFHESI